MTIDDEEFFAWLDGELDPARSAAVDVLVAADPALSARAAEHLAMRDRLRGAFAPLMDAPAPDRIGGAPLDLAAARSRREARRAAGVPIWASMAATLVLGLGLGTLLASGGSSGPVTVERGQLVAASSLATALDKQLASAGTGGGEPRIGLTFRDGEGAICRSFSGAAGSSGLACRKGGQWQVRGLFGHSAGGGGDYRMAAGDSPQLAALIEQTIAGEPFDAQAERAARDKGWR
jgi:hypothetical protein